MTEEEAKTKWCFHFIASHTDPRSAPSQVERESGETSPFRHHCIGSACMAWRGRESDSFRRMADEAFRIDGTKMVATPADMDGYCGLAGQP